MSQDSENKEEKKVYAFQADGIVGGTPVFDEKRGNILKVDPNRIDRDDTTGIYIRAQSPDGHWVSIDINCLDKESLKIWLRSRNGKNEFAENVVGILLGHGHLWTGQSKDEDQNSKKD